MTGKGGGVIDALVLVVVVVVTELVGAVVVVLAAGAVAVAVVVSGRVSGLLLLAGQKSVGVLFPPTTTCLIVNVPVLAMAESDRNKKAANETKVIFNKKVAFI